MTAFTQTISTLHVQCTEHYKKWCETLTQNQTPAERRVSVRRQQVSLDLMYHSVINTTSTIQIFPADCQVYQLSMHNNILQPRTPTAVITTLIKINNGMKNSKNYENNHNDDDNVDILKKSTTRWQLWMHVKHVIKRTPQSSIHRWCMLIWLNS